MIKDLFLNSKGFKVWGYSRELFSVSSKANCRGQVAILFALIFTFMFVLFAFVIDFGHLINNKINLQIAADTAAYAGAAWQSRTLNRISMVNYRLRQNLKELALRVNVTHLRHNRNFPRGSEYFNGPNRQHLAEPFVCQQAHGYQAISGLRYAQDTNICKNASPTGGGIPPIVVPPVIASFDPFAVAIAAQIRRIQQEANRECRAAASDNSRLVQYLIQVFQRRSQFEAQQVSTLTDWLNSVGREDNAATSDHPLIRAAYETARKNLTFSNLQDGGGFQMEILQPEGRQYLQLERTDLSGGIPYFNFNVEGNGCVGRPGIQNFSGIPASFNKVPSVLTFFAVKLTARPRLMFMPASWITAGFPQLVAISAAKPFGSRIGPHPSLDPLVPVPNRIGNRNPLINFSVRPSDNLGLNNAKLMAYYDALHPYNSQQRPDGNRRTGWPMPQRGSPGRQALQAIRAPTIFDALFYTIFPDPIGSNVNNDYLEPEFALALYPDYLETADAANDTVADTRQPATSPYFPAGVGSRNRGQGWIQVNAENTGSGGPYQGYAEESLSSHSVTSAVGLPLINGDDKAIEFGFAPPSLIHSGWAPPGKEGRIGYGVKFIGMDALVRTIRVNQNQAGARGRISNPPTGDPNVNNVIH